MLKSKYYSYPQYLSFSVIYIRINSTNSPTA